MCHENTAFEIGLAEDVGKGRRVVNVETVEHQMLMRLASCCNLKVYRIPSAGDEPVEIQKKTGNMET